MQFKSKQNTECNDPESNEIKILKTLIVHTIQIKILQIIDYVIENLMY